MCLTTYNTVLLLQLTVAERLLESTESRAVHVSLSLRVLLTSYRVMHVRNRWWIISWFDFVCVQIWHPKELLSYFVDGAQMKADRINVECRVGCSSSMPFSPFSKNCSSSIPDTYVAKKQNLPLLLLLPVSHTYMVQVKVARVRSIVEK